MRNKLPRLAAFAIVIAGAVIALRDQIHPAISPPATANQTAASEPATAESATTENSPSDAPYEVPPQVASPASAVPASPAPIVTSTVATVKKRTIGDELLLKAAAQLERRDSVSARLRHQVFLAGKQLYGLGSYWQQGSGEELRVRLELQIAGQEAALLQVSNNRYLWVERRLPTGRAVTCVDLRQLRAESEMNAAKLDDLQPGTASWLPTQTDLMAHSGGLPSMLAALEQGFTFLPPQAMRLAAPSDADSQAASIPVFAIVGHWRPECLATLITDKPSESPDDPQSIPSAGSSHIPARLPEEVLILVGQSDLFPYRIEYRKLQTPIAANQSGTPIPYQLSANPMVVLELTDVAFDVPIEDAGKFDYHPGDTDFTDQTATVLERLRRERTQQLATRAATPLK